MKGGESQLVIEAGGIFPTTPKIFESKAQQHLFKGGEQVHIPLPYLPEQQKQKYGLWFDLRDYWIDNKQSHYLIMNIQGDIIEEGIVPKNQIVKLDNLESNEELSIHLYNKDQI